MARPMRTHRNLCITYTSLTLTVIGLNTACICDDPMTQPFLNQGAQLIDFDRLNTLTGMAFDITYFGEDKLTEQELRNKYEVNGVQVAIREVSDVEVTYMLITDHQNRRHTIVLPGTTNNTNQELDFQGELVSDDELGVPLHTGFRETARAIHDDVVSLLDPSYRISCIGFSLGGAGSVILAAYLQHENFEVLELITFGQPSVTDESGVAGLVNLPLLRVVSGDDPFSTFPGGSYVQFGTELILLDGPTIVYLTEDSPDYALAQDLVVALNDTSFLDHLAYPERIASKLDVDVTQVRFSDRNCFLTPRTPPE